MPKSIVIDDQDTIKKIEAVANYLGVKSRVEAVRIAITEYLRKMESYNLTQE